MSINQIKPSTSRQVFNIFNIFFLGVVGLSTLYPFWDSFIVSISPLDAYLRRNHNFFTNSISLEPYKYMIGQSIFWRSYANTIFITAIGTSLSMLVTTMAAYVLSKPELKGQRIIMFLVVFTMMFSGGLIPTYIIVSNLGLIDSLFAMIFPTLVMTYNLIILRNFFGSVPASLEEAALISGCSEVGVLFKIVIPVSKPAIMTIALFYAVYYWNNFFSAVMYIYSIDKWPLQLFLRSLLFETDMAYQSGGDSLFLLGQPMKMAAVMMALIPIMMIYPFFQKYFAKGVMLGAIKE